jgi:hypothetical protein
MPEVNDCEPKCPPGYVLSPSFIEAYFEDNGFYACIPQNAQGASRYATCWYKNPYCAKKKSSHSQVSEYIAKSLEDELLTSEGIAGLNANSTYTAKIIKFVTLDPSLLSEINSNETTFENNSFYVFIAEAYKILVGTLFSSSFLFVALGIGWFGMLSLGAHVMREELGGHAVSPKLFLARLMLLGSALWLPFPHQAVTDTGAKKDVWQPVSFDAVRTAVMWGNKLADEAAYMMDMKFLQVSFTHIYDTADGMLSVIEKEAQQLYDQLKDKEKLLKVCIDTYGITDFTDIPVDKIPDADTKILAEDVKKLGGLKSLPWIREYYFSKAKCKQIAIQYKQLVLKYNTIAREYAQAEDLKKLALFKVGIDGVLKHPEEYLKDKDKSVRAAAESAIMMKKLGWISFPLVTMPLAKMIFTMNPQEILSIDMHDPSILAKAIGLLSLPPGNWFLGTVARVFNHAADLLGSVAGAVIGGATGTIGGPEGTGIGSFLGAIALGLVGKIVQVAASGLIFAGALAFTYWLTLKVLNALPILVFVATFVMKFVGWCLDIIKTLVALPFLFLHGFSTRSHTEAYYGMRQVGVIMVYPLLLLAASLAAFFGMEVARFLISDLGCRVVDIIGVVKDDGGMVSSFAWSVVTSNVLKGLFFWSSIVAESVLAYKLTMHTPEWILTKARFRIEGAGDQLSSSVFEGTIKKAIPV